MSDIRKDTYAEVQCLVCVGGREQDIAGELNRLDGVTVIAAVKLKKEWRQGAWHEVQKAMLPGYIFLYIHEAALSPAERAVLRPLRILKYNDGSTLLTGWDRKFADWLWKQGGTIEISKALCHGGRVEIMDGPLADLGGEIVKVDWRKQIAKDAMDIEGGLNIWLSFDCVEAAGDPARAGRRSWA